MMDRNALLNCAIDDGITEIPLAYPRPDQAQKRAGAIAAFEACRAKSDQELLALYDRSSKRVADALLDKAEDYWYWRMYYLQVEWVLNVLSAAYYNQGLPVLITPTARGLFKAADILGVREP